jgi:hypothetical protein
MTDETTDNGGGPAPEPVRMFLRRYRVALSADGKFAILTLLGMDHDRKDVRIEVAISSEEVKDVLANMTKQEAEVRGHFEAKDRKPAN